MHGIVKTGVSTVDEYDDDHNNEDKDGIKGDDGYFR